MKLVFEEAESGALALWLTEQEGLPKLSSEVAVIELVRTCRRRDEAAEPAARQLLVGLDLVPLTRDLVEGAVSSVPSSYAASTPSTWPLPSPSPMP